MWESIYTVAGWVIICLDDVHERSRSIDELNVRTMEKVFVFKVECIGFMIDELYR